MTVVLSGSLKGKWQHSLWDKKMVIFENKRLKELEELMPDNLDLLRNSKSHLPRLQQAWNGIGD